MTVFIKRGEHKQLICEKEGLEVISQKLTDNRISLRTPKVLEQEKQALHLEFIEATRPTTAQWFDAGAQLAKFHTIKQRHYGWTTDNFIGLGKQTNTISHNWADFFINYRLLAKANELSNRVFRNSLAKTIEQQYEPLSALLNKDTSPSLLHGDLWQGNILFSKDDIWLIDPAVYYGDSEVDIAMTMMFGGFAPEFYEGYESVKALSADFETKREIYNLYHYLNHYLLFGESYLAGCERGLDVIAKL